jgi:DNA replication protein DnaC
MAACSRHQAGVREEGDRTLENFDWTFNPALPQAQVRDLASGGYLLRKEHILLCGPVGVGKSHLAEALGHQACRQGHRILFTETSRLLSDLGGGHADGSWDLRFCYYLQPALLIIDDFAMREFSVLQADDLYELISERARAGSMIVTSNRSPADWVVRSACWSPTRGLPTGRRSSIGPELQPHSWLTVLSTGLKCKGFAHTGWRKAGPLTPPFA